MSPKKPAKKRAANKPVGRPSLYRDEYAEQARKLCLLGATDAELADFFGVAESTIYEWKGAHREFSESITQGKVIADAEVAEALYTRAKGYTRETEKTLSNGVSVPHAEHYPPDTQAASLWLRNRQPAKWRDKVQAEVSGPGGAPVEMKVVVELVRAEDGRPA